MLAKVFLSSVTLLLLVSGVSATSGAIPAIYFAIIGIIIFTILLAIGVRIVDHYHICEQVRNYGMEYPEDDGRFEMKVFRGHGYYDGEVGGGGYYDGEFGGGGYYDGEFGGGGGNAAESPVLYEKRRHEKRGLAYEELGCAAERVGGQVARNIENKQKPAKPGVYTNLLNQIDEPVKPDKNVELESKPETTALSPRQPRAVTPDSPRVMSPSQKRPKSPTTKTVMTPPPRSKTLLSPKTPRSKTPLSPKTLYKTLPHAKTPTRAAPTEPLIPPDPQAQTLPRGYHYQPAPAGGFYPQPGGGYSSPGGGAYPNMYPYPAPHPAYPAYSGYPQLPSNQVQSSSNPGQPQKKHSQL